MAAAVCAGWGAGLAGAVWGWVDGVMGGPATTAGDSCALSSASLTVWAANLEVRFGNAVSGRGAEASDGTV